MKKIAILALVMLAVVVLSGCGAQKNALDTGHEMVKAGDCAGAAPYLEATIIEPDSALDLAYAYFLKARCAEQAGDFPVAYENYYAAKVVACYVVSHEVHVNLNTYARSEYCQRIIPEKLAELAPKVGDKTAIEHIESKVNNVLNAKYLQRFEKRLN